MKCQACGKENCSCDKSGQCTCGPDCICTKRVAPSAPPREPRDAKPSK
jgi:hypothetical protein